LSLELVALSFFKSNGIDYYFEKPIIKFPCVDCGSEAVMHSHTTKWECKQCNMKGTITKLIELKNQDWHNDKVYNPKKEKEKIKQLFEKVCNQNSTNKNIQTLREKVEELLKYHEEKNLG
jgi:ribosomal protein S27AE